MGKPVRLAREGVQISRALFRTDRIVLQNIRIEPECCQGRAEFVGHGGDEGGASLAELHDVGDEEKGDPDREDGSHPTGEQRTKNALRQFFRCHGDGAGREVEGKRCQYQ